MKTIRVKVKPGARHAGLQEQDDGSWVARVKAPPVDGRANEELIALIAQHFEVRKAQVSIRSGTTGRFKVIQVGRGA